jgi:hypothetical protein
VKIRRLRASLTRLSDELVVCGLHGGSERVWKPVVPSGDLPPDVFIQVQVMGENRSWKLGVTILLIFFVARTKGDQEKCRLVG